MDHWTVAKSDSLKTDLAEKLEILCRQRLEEWRDGFRQKFPRQHGSITFGMGSELVLVGGRQVNSWDTERYTVLKPLFEAIYDIWNITNQYRLACPDDFAF